MSSEYERDETDDEILSFDLGPEPFDPEHPTRLPSDEWLDDHQQGLHPGGSEPRHDPYAKYMAMPNPPSIMDLMRNDMDTGELDRAPPPRARAPPQTMRWDFDFVRDEPPPVKRLSEDVVQTSTPLADSKSQNIRPRPALETTAPTCLVGTPSGASSQTSGFTIHANDGGDHSSCYATARTGQHTAQDKGPEADIDIVPDTPSPVAKPGRSRGRGSWRAPPKPTPAPGVGTRSMTRHAEMQRREDEEALAASARWPPSPDLSTDIHQLTRELHIRDEPRLIHAELESALPSGEEGTSETVGQPPAVGLISRQQDTYFIPPPSRAVGGARGRSVPVSTATLGLIHRQDPALAALLREEPASLMMQRTRRKVYSTIRLLRSGLIGQMASLQQWEKAMNDQDEL